MSTEAIRFDRHPRPTDREDDLPAVNVEESIAISKAVRLAIKQVGQFDDRLRKLEGQQAWIRQVQQKLDDFRERLDSMQRRLATFQNPQAFIQPPNIQKQAPPAAVVPRSLWALLEEIVVVLVGRVYADAPREDAKAIETGLQQMLEQVRKADDLG